MISSVHNNINSKYSIGFAFKNLIREVNSCFTVHYVCLFHVININYHTNRFVDAFGSYSRSYVTGDVNLSVDLTKYGGWPYARYMSISRNMVYYVFYHVSEFPTCNPHMG